MDGLTYGHLTHVIRSTLWSRLNKLTLVKKNTKSKSTGPSSPVRIAHVTVQ